MAAERGWLETPFLLVRVLAESTEEKERKKRRQNEIKSVSYARSLVMCSQLYGPYRHVNDLVYLYAYIYIFIFFAF